MTCAKKVVRAHLLCKDDRSGHAGTYFIGENSCRKPQTSCPRKPGEGYRPCLTICAQPMHAEVDALFKAEDAGAEPRGGHMVIFHHRICDECRSILEKYDITWELRP